MNDTYTFAQRAMLESKTCLDLSQMTSCAGFIVEGTQPTSTDRRFVFKVDDNLFCIKNGAVQFFNYPLTIDNVLNFGSTAEQLLEVQNLNTWLGKKIYPVIALYNDGSPIQPSVKLSLRCASFNTTFTKTYLSPVYDIEGSKIISITADKILTGNATLNVRARILIDGAWQDWQELYTCRHKAADAVQISAEHIVTRLDGRDSAQLKNLQIKYIPRVGKCGDSILHTQKISLPDKLFKNTDAPIFDDDIFLTRGEISSVVDKSYLPVFDNDPVTRADMLKVIREGKQDFSETKLLTAYALVEHDELRDAVLSAKICLQDAPETFHVNLGTADGSTQAFNLGANVLPHTLQVRANGFNVIPVSFDSSTGILNVKAAGGTTLTATFSAQAAETFDDMQVQFTERNRTCFVYQSAAGKKFVTVKILAKSQEGVNQQTYSAGCHVLDHKTFPENVDSGGDFRLDNGNLLTCTEDVYRYSWKGAPVATKSVKTAFG